MEHGVCELRGSAGARVFRKGNAPVEAETYKEISNAAEAAAYMQQVTLKLRTWRESLDKASSSGRRDSSTPATRKQDH